jgi:branched-chain amino acid transport system substrate-binding protein
VLQKTKNGLTTMKISSLHYRACLCLLIAAAVLLTAGCIPPELMLRSSDPELINEKTVKVGVILPLSGRNSKYGIQMLEGIRLAEEEINSTRGVSGKEIEVLVFDNCSSREGSEQAAQAAVSANAVALIAGYSSDEVGGILPYAARYRIPAVIPLATAEEYVGFSKFVYRAVYSDRQQSEAIAAYLWYWRQVKRIGIAVNMDYEDEYSRNIAREVATSFGDFGGSVVRVVEFKDGDFEHQLKELLTHGPEAILLPCEGVQAAKMLKFLRQCGYKGIIFGADSWDSLEFYAELKDVEDCGECFYIGLFGSDKKNTAYAEFEKKFREKHFYSPGGEVSLSYDALKMLAIGLNNATNILEFERNWQSIKNYNAASGLISTGKHGTVDSTIYIKAVAPATYLEPVPHAKEIKSFPYSRLESYRN